MVICIFFVSFASPQGCRDAYQLVWSTRHCQTDTEEICNLTSTAKISIKLAKGYAYLYFKIKVDFLAGVTIRHEAADSYVYAELEYCTCLVQLKVPSTIECPQNKILHNATKPTLQPTHQRRSTLQNHLVPLSHM